MEIDKQTLEKMSDTQLESLRDDISYLLSRRAIDSEDPEALIKEMFRIGFNGSGDPLAPKHLRGGIIGLTGMVRTISSTRHRCSLWTVRQSEDEPEQWFWSDQCPSYLDSESVKAGGLRQTVALHRLPFGALIIQHTMTKRGEDPHQRQSVRAFVVSHKVNDDGEVVDVTLDPMRDAAVRRLPPPPEQGGY